MIDSSRPSPLLPAPPSHHIHKGNEHPPNQRETMTRISTALLLLLSSAVVASEAFFVQPLTFVGSVRSTRLTPAPVILRSKKDGDKEIKQAEEAAAIDAHDCADPGMEAAAEERAVMMAYDMGMKKKKHEIHAETGGGGAEADEEQSPTPEINAERDINDEIQQAEEDAAFDAHDCSDPGMEAAAEERAVMMAYDMGMKKKKHEIHAETGGGGAEADEEQSPTPEINAERDINDEIHQAEEDAAFDAHDCSDPGMEAAAEERAMMMAYDMGMKKKKHEIHAETGGGGAEADEEQSPTPEINAERDINNEIQQAEEDAAFDAHDCSDPGMEAAAEERAVMMAYDLGMKKKKHEIHAETGGGGAEADEEQSPTPEINAERDINNEIQQAEEDAAFDAHDCSDPGMEAAAEERAVMMAYDMGMKKKKHEIHAEIHGGEEGKQAPDPHNSMKKDEKDGIEQAEEDAAHDAHDCSDAGMEAAAEERAVMMAYELAEKKKKEARKKQE